MHCCNFAAAIVQSEEIESWGAQYVGKHFGIPMLQLASFAADPDGKEVFERKNHHRTLCGFLELLCATSSSCIP
jgi:hypothetical protein